MNQNYLPLRGTLFALGALWGWGKLEFSFLFSLQTLPKSHRDCRMVEGILGWSAWREGAYLENRGTLSAGTQLCFPASGGVDFHPNGVSKGHFSYPED